MSITLKNHENCLLVLDYKSSNDSKILILQGSEEILANGKPIKGKGGDIQGNVFAKLYSNGLELSYKGFGKTEDLVINKNCNWIEINNNGVIDNLSKSELVIIADSIKNLGGYVVFELDTTYCYNYQQKQNVEYIISRNSDKHYTERLQTEVDSMKLDFAKRNYETDYGISFRLGSIDKPYFAPTRLYSFDFYDKTIDIMLIKKKLKSNEIQAYYVEGLERRKYSVSYFLPN